MGHAAVGILRPVTAAGAADVSLRADDLDELIRRVDAAHAVRRDGSSFAIELETLAQIAPGHVSLITAAVQRANSDLLASPSGIEAASGEDIAKRIAELGAVLKKSADVIAHLQALVAGTKVDAHWWGLTLSLSHEASDAIATLTTVDVLAVLGAISLVAPVAAGVSAIVVAAGGVLAGWVKASDKGKGTKIKLYMWVVPWVSENK